MTPVVCLSGNVAGYPEGGGHVWVYLNWALALREAGCRVVWLECLDELSAVDRQLAVAHLHDLLAPFGLAEDLVLIDLRSADEPPPFDADALIDLAYLPSSFVRRFRRSALIDLDPGLTQAWSAAGCHRHRWSRRLRHGRRGHR